MGNAGTERGTAEETIGAMTEKVAVVDQPRNKQGRPTRQAGAPTQHKL